MCLSTYKNINIYSVYPVICSLHHVILNLNNYLEVSKDIWTEGHQPSLKLMLERALSTLHEWLLKGCLPIVSQLKDFLWLLHTSSMLPSSVLTSFQTHPPWIPSGDLAVCKRGNYHLRKGSFIYFHGPWHWLPAKLNEMTGGIFLGVCTDSRPRHGNQTRIYSRTFLGSQPSTGESGRFGLMRSP